MRCRSVLTRVDALRTGELPDAEEKIVHEHMARCESCADSIHDVSALATSVKKIVPAPPRSCRDALADSYEQLRDGNESVWVAFSDRGLKMILRGGTLDDLRAAYCTRFGRLVQPATLPDPLRKQVLGALHGEGVDAPRVDWSDDLTPLEREVLGTLTRIPRGEVRTYEWVARQAGHPRAVRAVGSICARNVVPFVVPCHRVVPATGGIGQYAFGPAVKREMLAREGVNVDELDALAKKGVRYIGSRTTKIVCFPTCHAAQRIHEENRVPFRGMDEAMTKGYRPCRKCQPFAISA
ncbi:MAG TPA: methylated-DNA--[protein]-cysteine S-methyltransferase [Thermoanaerobaculia bacterium]|nr:methylated-DNA--[protein]-cysteine S-methyltransferase [Thermoanaerobaculia bacterium]